MKAELQTELLGFFQSLTNLDSTDLAKKIQMLNGISSTTKERVKIKLSKEKREHIEIGGGVLEPTLLKMVTDYHKMKMKTDVRKGTKVNYDIMFMHICKFLRAKKINSIREFSQKGLFDFYEYLQKNGLKNKVSLNKTARYLLQACQYAFVNEVVAHNHTVNFTLPKLKTRHKEQVKLSLTEIEKLKRIKINENYLINTKNLFLFQCYTGLSYADLMSFKKSEIKKVKDQFLIIGFRSKSNQKYIIPFNNDTEQIWENMQCSIHKISNQKYNEYLKELAKKAKIKKRLTTHVARKTFGQIMLDKGYPIEAVSRMLGHSDIGTTQKYYVKVGEELILNEIEKLKIR